MERLHEPSDFKVGTKFYGTVNNEFFEVVNINTRKTAAKKKNTVTIVFVKEIKTKRIFTVDIETLCRCKIEIFKEESL